MLANFVTGGYKEKLSILH